MLCCLIGGGLLAWLARSARRKGSPAPSPLLAMLFGFGASMLAVELIISVLVPLGVVDVTGPLASRVALVVAPALIAVPAARAGAAGALLTRSGTAALMAAAVAGALVAEEADLHVFTLHSAPGLLAGWRPTFRPSSSWPACSPGGRRSPRTRYSPQVFASRAAG